MELPEISSEFITLLRELFPIIGFYLFWVFLHFASAHLYVYFCTPNTITGFLFSPFQALAPHCNALRWTIYNGGNQIATMWLSLGSWLIYRLSPLKT